MTLRRPLPGAGLDPAGLQSCHYQDFDPVPRSAGVARRFVVSHSPAMPAEAGAALELLTSELVTNAIIHARTPLDVGVLVTADAVVVGVHDQDLASPLQDPYPGREGGWGLGLVAALAQSWSTTRHSQGGKTAWFRLLRTPVEPAADGAAARLDSDRRDR